MFLVTTDFIIMRRSLKLALLKQVLLRLQSQSLISRNYFKFNLVEKSAIIVFYLVFKNSV